MNLFVEVSNASVAEFLDDLEVFDYLLFKILLISLRIFLTIVLAKGKNPKLFTVMVDLLGELNSVYLILL